MAQKDIHPKLNNISLILNDGTNFKIKTTYGKEGDELKLDIDPTNHPAWRKDSANFINVKDDKIAKFKKKFGDFM